MLFTTFLAKIPLIKQAVLPNKASHLKMIPPNRKLDFLKNKTAQKPREAAVLCLFYPNATNEVEFILILRKTYKGTHSNQIAFPGGKKELSDADFEQTALRETEEEIGVDSKAIRVFKTMSKVYIPPSNFMVYPFLGYATETPNFIKEAKEVEKIIKIPFETLLKQENTTKKVVETSYGIAIEVPIFVLQDTEVWGATAMILQEIKDLFTTENQ